MKMRWISIILMFVLIAGYIAFLYYYEKEDTNEAPQIIFEETHLEEITEHMIELATELKVEPRKLLSHVLDYRIFVEKL